MGKGEIARYEQFLLFPQCFKNACFPGASKGVIVWEWVKMMSDIVYLIEKEICEARCNCIRNNGCRNFTEIMLKTPLTPNKQINVYVQVHGYLARRISSDIRPCWDRLRLHRSICIHATCYLSFIHKYSDPYPMRKKDI